MASVLSLRPHSPLKRSFSDNPYFNSCSPLKNARLAPFSDITIRNASACSLYSFGSSNGAADWFQNSENTPPPTSQSLLDLAPEHYGQTPSHGSDAEQPRKRACGVDRPAPSFSKAGLPANPYTRKIKSARNATAPPSLKERSGEPKDARKNNFVESELFNFYEAIRVPLPEGRFSEQDERHQSQDISLEPPIVEYDSRPFRRWVSSLRRRRAGRGKEGIVHVDPGVTRALDSGTLAPLVRQMPESVRRTSESISSSLGFVTAIKSASITIAGTSIAPPSDCGTNNKFRSGNRSSHCSDTRKSLENHPLGPVMDESAWLRSLQRRRVVEELISSEESYIADLKVLINDYFMILTALPTLPGQTKLSIQNNISQILQLHEDLLSELHAIVPQADFTQSAQESQPMARAKHIRFHSVDIIPGRLAEHKVARRLRHSLEIGRSPDRRSRGLAIETKTAEEIARIFNKHMKRFFTYEEYGAHWTTMSQDLTTMCKDLHGWQEYERGVEALQKIVTSVNNREAGSRKALSFSDLLIKPIQRVCKYPLLFEDLCRQTPSYDDPEAHAELEKALFRLQETIREVNKAKDDPKTRRLIEITWQLQDRLAFQEQKLSRALVFRLLGHVLLCGVLHVTYQSPDRIRGQYMVCVLYKSCLVLATVSRFHSPYTVVASISLANASIEESDNGRGLQCHTAPHTWKFVFEHGHRLYEIILSACTSHEEEVWKKQLRERIVYETHDFVEGQSNMHDMFTSLSLDLKSLGPVFGHANSLVRRMSMHRAATLGAKTNISQVIIKNTQAQKLQDAPQPFSPSMMTRSQSHMSSNLVPTLAPRRAERMRIESTLEDVWTKDSLPFPGMSNRRVEHQIRASATSVMRKLSMASITSNFSRRSPSFSSMSNTMSEDSFGSRAHKAVHGSIEALSAVERRPAPTVVDFHNAPAAFLPTDFEVEDTRPASRRRRLANRAAGPDRSSDKLTQARPKRARRLSTHMISLPRSDSSARFMGRTTSRTSDTIVSHIQEPPTEQAQVKQIEGLKRPDEKPIALRDSSPNVPPSRKFMKNKSKIFKFWI